MKILVLGGTRFVGRHIVHAALDGDHDVTLFNRGITQPQATHGTRLLTGDRRVDVTALTHQEWDCVIDVSGYLAQDVARSADALRPVAAHYVYISTVSVYPPGIPENADEDEAMLDIPVDAPEGAPFAYGGQKANCERALISLWGPEAVTIIRPTIVIGPYDTTDRFTWWVRRVAQGGRLPVPARRDQPIQLIDGRDLAAFTVHTAVERIAGTFNAAGPVEPLTIGSLIDRIAVVSGSHAREDVPVTSADLAAQEVNLPLTLPDSFEGSTMFQVSIARSLAAGMKLRSLDDSIRDTLAWDRGRGLPPLATGPDADAEDRLLASAG